MTIFTVRQKPPLGHEGHMTGPARLGPGEPQMLSIPHPSFSKDRPPSSEIPGKSNHHGFHGPRVHLQGLPGWSGGYGGLAALGLAPSSAYRERSYSHMTPPSPGR